MPTDLAMLREKLSALARTPSRNRQDTFRLGWAGLDRAVGGGLMRGAVHEIFAASVADAGTAAGFTVALVRRAVAGRSVVWIRQTYARLETGGLYAPGLSALGFDPGELLLVEVKDGFNVLRAGLEAARCPALGCVVIEPWGNSKALDFTATRRLGLAASNSGTTVFLLRLAAEPRQSAAQTRWQVSAGASQPLAANAPGFATFDIKLLRHRSGSAGQSWRLEWDHEQHVFRQPAPRIALSRPVVAVPARGPALPPPDTRIRVFARAR